MKLDQARGTFLGLAVGDALGCTLEFSKRNAEMPRHEEISGGGPFKVEAGDHTDDTCMALALASSLVENSQLDPVHVMDEFLEWYVSGKYSPTNECIDIGNTVRAALDRWKNDRYSPFCGPQGEFSSGNGGIMRLCPIIIWHRYSYEKALTDAVVQSMLTHASNNCIRYSQIFASILWHGSVDKNIISGLDTLALPDDETWPAATGDVMSSLKAAVWAVRTTSNFRDAVIKAVNLGDDSDTVGAITGQIAGRIYGAKNIPKNWLRILTAREEITELATALFKKAPKTMKGELK